MPRLHGTRHERALFTLVDSGKLDKAWALLKGAEEATFDGA